MRNDVSFIKGYSCSEWRLFETQTQDYKACEYEIYRVHEVFITKHHAYLINWFDNDFAMKSKLKYYNYVYSWTLDLNLRFNKMIFIGVCFILYIW